MYSILYKSMSVQVHMQVHLQVQVQCKVNTLQCLGLRVLAHCDMRVWWL